MEVHAHTHTPRKKFIHYFWEFFMLFLAVTLGFMVENIREHYIEHKREVEYIRSYIGDLHTDIYQLDSLISYSKKRNEIMDSLSQLLDIPDPDVSGKKLYYDARVLTLTFPFFSNDRTIQQLKNGGNLRLIKKQTVSNAMMDYDREVRFLENIRNREESYVRDYIRFIEEIFDGRIFNKMLTKKLTFDLPEDNPYLLKKDKATILRFITHVHFMKSANTFLQINFNKTRATAQKTLDVIKVEYHLE